jgi:hypothetical protein
MSNLERFGKLARRAYYQAIDGWAHDREWDKLSESERLAWESVGCILRNVDLHDTSRDEYVLEAFREGRPPAPPQGAPSLARIQRLKREYEAANSDLAELAKGAPEGFSLPTRWCSRCKANVVYRSNYLCSTCSTP